ncbi:hypothetical protein QTH89_25775 [Variovorax sp. J22G21]|uniref:hypothetical protein n=1 Tax=Variovorax fucosicus TaxID=3053517 RepID=UPI0025782EBF|nr:MULTISPECIES: hypothetical protein [unclassified Variovorax]MDM0039802.1 hypothetical protein [Variovorax sp. J22R193]MDM0064649.1 hypothetical protein [Variovorax sp. J22G21]
MLVEFAGGVLIGKNPLLPSLPPPQAASTQAAIVVNDVSKTFFSKIIIYISGQFVMNGFDRPAWDMLRICVLNSKRHIEEKCRNSG